LESTATIAVFPASAGPAADEAFVASITGLQTALLAYILTLAPADRDAEDILQRCNVVLWRKRASFQPGSNFKAWAFAVARWEVLAVMKERRAKAWLVFEDEVAEIIGDHLAEMPDQRLAGLARAEALRGCLARLSPKHRCLVLERYADGRTTEECAARLGRPAASLRVTLHRLRASLRRCLLRQLGEEGRK
jgi:RNA polymerase sigma-70 factor, ECF subfamily